MIAAVIESRPGPAGHFLLLKPAHGASCPECGYVKPTVWAYAPTATPLNRLIIACPDCKDEGLDTAADRA